jgi:hypothetical protein
MAGGVEEDPERVAGLVLVLHGAQGDDSSFTLVEVIDVDVEVHLLGRALPGPLRSPIPLDTLERDRRSLVGMLDVGPAAVVVDVDRPVEEGTVEAGEFAGIRAVDRDDGEAGDGHVRTLEGAVAHPQ